MPRKGEFPPLRPAIPWPSRRSGRVAEGGALLRRYGGECLHRGFESLLLRSRTPDRLRLPAGEAGLRRSLALLAALQPVARTSRTVPSAYAPRAARQERERWSWVTRYPV